jgi:hypothetical protein
MTLAYLLDGYEAGRITRIAAVRWLGYHRHVDFLTALDVNHRRLPKGRLPLRPHRRQIKRVWIARRKPIYDA